MPSFRSLKLVLCAGLVGLALSIFPTAASSPETTGSIPTKMGPSGLPLPRFVSLKADKVNLRIGPGLKYAIEWRYLKSGIPMEIIQEYGNWRRVRDAQGAEGWINQSLLSGRRTGVAAPWQRGKEQTLSLRAEPSANAHLVATMEPGVIGRILTCNGQWCEMTFSGHTGWIDQSLVWGAYPGETYKD